MRLGLPLFVVLSIVPGATMQPVIEDVRSSAQAESAPPVLASLWPETVLRERLIPIEKWTPFPPIADRAGWEGLGPVTRQRILEAGARAAKTPLPLLPATLFLEYARDGNRSRFEEAMFARRDRLHALVLAECVEGRGRFLDAIVDTAWALAEESSWTVPAHQGAQRAGVGLPDTSEPIVDLFAAQTAHSIAWTLYLLADRLDQVSPLVRPRLVREVQRRILEPYLARDDFWWMGFGGRAGRPNNWNPWINSNVVAAALHLERDPVRRAALVHKALRSLDKYVGPHPRDGSCDEGPNYWGRAAASLFEALDVLHSASGGRLDVFDNPVVANMGRFIYRAHIAGTWMVNVGDSGPRVSIDRSLVFRYGRAVGDAGLQSFGASGASEETIPLDDRSLGRTLDAVFGWPEMSRQREARPPLPRDVWLPNEDMQLMAARDREGAADGFYVAAWGSHNDQSHNHNDVGNVMVFIEGAPVLIDVGRPTYTAKTFSSRRYEIWAMQSAYHNVPSVNGVMQEAGRQYAARDVSYTASDEASELSMELASAYGPGAGISSWKRRVRLTRGREAAISEAFALSAPSSDVRLVYMTPCEASAARPGQLALTCKAGEGGGMLAAMLRYPERDLEATIERVDLDDPAMTRVWGDHVNRIVLRATGSVRKGTWTVTIGKGAAVGVKERS